MPVASRTAPAPRKSCVNKPKIFVLGPVAKRREIRDQADVPEQCGHGRIGRDRENVPDQRAAKLRPEAHRIRIREKPVSRQPRTASMQQREHRGAGHGEKRHRLGETIDRGAPFLIEQQENGRDQGSGVTDTDPPNEVDNVERPTDRLIVSPHPDTVGEEPNDREHQQLRDHERDTKPDEPSKRRPLFKRNVADAVGNTCKRVLTLDHCRAQLLL